PGGSLRHQLYISQPRFTRFRVRTSESTVQLHSRDPELPGGLHLVAAGFAHGLLDGLALEDAEVGVAQRWGIGPDGQREGLGVDEPSVAENRCPFEHVSQLADVAGPVVTVQCLYRVWCQIGRGAAKFAEKACGERQNVVAPLAQRRNANVEDIQTVVEVGTEFS